MRPIPSRVGFVVGLPWDENGGVQQVTRLVGQERSRSGAHVFVIALGQPGCDSDERQEGGLLVRRVPPECAQAQVLNWCADHQLDEIQIQHLSGFDLGLPQRLRQLGVPVEWTIHDYHPWCPRGQMWDRQDEVCEDIDLAKCAGCWSQTWPEMGVAAGLQSKVEQRLVSVQQALLACDRVSMPSSQSIEVGERCGVPKGQLDLRENPRWRPIWQPSRRAFKADDIRVGYLGSVQPSKGVLPLARWIDELGSPFSLQVHGPGESYHGNRDTLQALMDLTNRAPRIQWKGAYGRDELPLILAGLDLVCVPSLWNEVFGLVAREAAAAGVPVFVSDRGGLQDAPARVLPAGDEAAWKSALLEFAQTGSGSQ